MRRALTGREVRGRRFQPEGGSSSLRAQGILPEKGAFELGSEGEEILVRKPLGFWGRGCFLEWKMKGYERD